MRRRSRRASEAPVHSSSSNSGSGSSSSASSSASSSSTSSSTSSSLDALGYRPTFAAALQMLGGDDATSALVPARFVVIDTPGMRSLGLVEDDGGLDASFAEIAAVAAGCRFSDCTHGDEPGCAVTEALACGELDPERLASRHKLEREVRAAEVRRDPAQAANAKRRMKTIHVAQRARYKLDPKTRQ
jgi:ribosome biogenesis GTPase / thiamine phosphate phosphatase